MVIPHELSGFAVSSRGPPFLIAGPVAHRPRRGSLFEDRYLIVPRTSMRLPCGVQPVPFQVDNCIWLIGKWSVGVVLTTMPESTKGLLVSLRLLPAMLITLARVMFDPACLSTSTIVYA